MVDGSANIEIARKRIAAEIEDKTGALDLGGLYLPSLPSELFALQHLRRLNLGGACSHVRAGRYRANNGISPWSDRSKIRHAIEHIKTFNCLEYLSVRFSDVDDLSFLAELNNLRWLDISVNEISDIQNLRFLTKLRRLDISWTNVSTLDALRCLRALRRLDFAVTDVSDIEPLSGLTRLSWLNGQASDINPLRDLTGLRYLYISVSNEVSSLEPLTNLLNLRSLSIAGGKITDLSPLCEIKSLRKVRCIRTSISDIEGLPVSNRLKLVDFSETNVSNIDHMASKHNLNYVYINGTLVNNLMSLATLRQLKYLNCSHTPIASLEPLRSTTSLHTLDCSHSAVTDLTPLSGLADLKYLDCSHTPIADLVPLAGLANMRWLDCSRTQVADLTPLAGFVGLQQLHCQGCRLQRNYPEIWGKPSLTRLLLEGSHIPGIPPEVLEGGYEGCLQQLRAHIADLQAGEVEGRDLKLLLLGNGRAGKTQLRNRLSGRDFEERWDSTHGVRVESTDFATGTAGSPARMHLWDFGGQDIYHGTHALFLRSPAINLLVWAGDTENADEYELDGLRFRNHRLQYWVELARRQGHPDSAVVVVQSKCDRVGDERRTLPLSTETVEALPYFKQLHYSAKPPERGRASLDEALADAIAWLRDPARLGTPLIGAGRVRVQRRLEELRDADAARPVEERQWRTLTQEQFEALCVEAGGVCSPEHLLDYLNNTGVVFYRKGLFHDLIVLDQAWALDAIYAVFDRTRCYRQLLWTRGRFTRALLESLVWREHGVEEQKLFLSMMQSCGICFVHREADDDTEYVAPDLLPERSAVTAELAEKWPEEGPIEAATFDYELLHPGLARTVIAEIGAAASVNALYWRGGVCVYEANTRSRGLVEQELETDGRGRIRVQTQGGQATALLERLARVVEEAQARLSIAPTLSARGVRSRAGATLASEGPASPPLDFRQPPVAAEEWYVSYAWGDATPEGSEREAVVDRLCDEAASRGIRIQRDKTSLGLGDRITTFMQRIGRGDRVFVVLSAKYLRSAFCMFELLELWRTSRQEGAAFLDRVRVYALPDAAIDSPAARTRVAIHWKQQHAELEALLREHGTDVIGESDFKRLRLMGAFYRDVSEILATMADIVRPRTFEELARYGFDDVVPGAR